MRDHICFILLIVVVVVVVVVVVFVVVVVVVGGGYLHTHHNWRHLPNPAAIFPICGQPSVGPQMNVSSTFPDLTPSESTKTYSDASNT